MDNDEMLAFCEKWAMVAAEAIGGVVMHERADRPERTVMMEARAPMDDAGRVAEADMKASVMALCSDIAKNGAPRRFEKIPANLHGRVSAVYTDLDCDVTARCTIALDFYGKLFVTLDWAGDNEWEEIAPGRWKQRDA